MRNEIKAILENFCGSTFGVAKSLVTVGFEIETQADARVFDEDSARDSARESLLEDISDTDVLDHLGIFDRSARRIIIERIDDVAGTFGVDYEDCVSDDSVDQMVDEYREDSDSPYWSGSDESPHSILGLLHHDDPSVTGPEYVTDGPVSYDRSIELAEKLYGREITCDEECSCHIHLQVIGVKHTGGDLLQQLIYDEISKRFNWLPVSVRDRIRSRPKWIQANPGACTKYNPVRLHDEYSTWEFRIFGNVQDAAEYEQCLIVALESLQCAYARFLFQENDTLSSIRWAQLANESMGTLKPIWQVMELVTANC